MNSETVYVVRDASGEYVKNVAGTVRTTASNEAYQFDTREEANAAASRTTDRIFARDAE